MWVGIFEYQSKLRIEPLNFLTHFGSNRQKNTLRTTDQSQDPLFFLYLIMYFIILISNHAIIRHFSNIIYQNQLSNIFYDTP